VAVSSVDVVSEPAIMRTFASLHSSGVESPEPDSGSTALSR
jgi:hypothetical protein